jgi:hypothetical protein
MAMAHPYWRKFRTWPSCLASFAAVRKAFEAEPDV